jgi:hypothetical protein
MALQRLVGTRQFIHYRPQYPIVIGCSYKLTSRVKDADHEPFTLLLLCLDDTT